MKVLLFQEAVDGRCTSSNYGHDTDTDATNWPIFAAQRGAFCHWPVSFVSMMGLFRYISAAKKKNDAANKSLGWPTGLIGTAQVFLYFFFSSFFCVGHAVTITGTHRWNGGKRSWQVGRSSTVLGGWRYHLHWRLILSLPLRAAKKERHTDRRWSAQEKQRPHVRFRLGWKSMKKNAVRFVANSIFFDVGSHSLKLFFFLLLAQIGYRRLLPVLHIQLCISHSTNVAKVTVIETDPWPEHDDWPCCIAAGCSPVEREKKMINLVKISTTINSIQLD